MTEDRRTRNQTVVVTGASAGIGTSPVRGSTRSRPTSRGTPTGPRTSGTR